MLPSFLFNSYRQYKADTDKIAAWLAETAKKCGYDPTAKEEAVEEIKKPKLKGRARKLARDAAAAGEGSASSQNGKGDTKERKYIVRVRDFLPMAQAIANSTDASLKIPRGFVNLLKRCVMARLGTAEWYEGLGQDEQNTSNHQYFANVLQRTLEILMPSYESKHSQAAQADTSATPADAPRTTDAHIGSLTNAFSVLEVEDVEEEYFDAMTNIVTSYPGNNKSAPVTSQYEVETLPDDDGEEWFHSMHCLFNDLHEIKHLIQTLCRAYLDGELDIATLAVVTNTAFDLVRRAEDDFTREMRPPKEYAGTHPHGKICELFYIDACVRLGLTPDHTPGHCVNIDEEHYPLVQESFLLSYRMLLTFGGDSGTILSTRPASLGTYNPGLDRTNLKSEELYEQDVSLLADFLVTMGPYVAHANTPNDDEMMKGLRDWFSWKPKPVSLWLTWALEVFLTTRHTLGVSSSRPLEDLQDFTKSAVRTLQEQLDFFAQKRQVWGLTAKDEKETRNIMKEIDEWALKDKMLAILNEQKMNPGRLKKSRVWEENEILKMHPLLCGMWKYSFHLQMQREGIHWVNRTFVMSIAHLYNAMKQCEYLPSDCYWADMEYLLDIHSEEGVFFGERPTTLEQCTKQLAMAQGVSAQTFARSRRQNQPRVVTSKTGGNFLKQSTPIASVFWPRFLAGQDLDLSLSSVETILSRRVEESARYHDYSALLDTRAAERASETNETEPNQPNEVDGDDSNGHSSTSHEHEHEHIPEDVYDQAILERWKKHRKLSMVEFLTELTQSMQEEHLDIQFDYFAFHRAVWGLLEDIQAASISHIPKMFHAEAVEFAMLPEAAAFVPGMIMNMACDVRKARNMAAIKPILGVDDEAMKAAAQIMQEFIEQQGSRYCEQESAMMEKRRLGHLMTGEGSPKKTRVGISKSAIGELYS